MPWALAGAAVSAGGSIVGSLISADASKSAAKSQAQSAANSLSYIKQVYGETTDNLTPYIGAGTSALDSLKSFYGIGGSSDTNGAQAAYKQYTNTPYYQFPLQQSTLATNRALAASGLNQSGGALRDISSLNSGYASQGLSSYLSGLTGLANSGQTAATSLGGIGTQTSQQVTGANTAYGNAQAAGTIGAANATTSGISSVGGALTNQNTQNSLSSLFSNNSASSYNSGSNATTGTGATDTTALSSGFY